jgi:glycogen debranching enzyme
MKHVDDFASIANQPFVHTETTDTAGARSYAIKDQDTFLVADAYGDITGGRDGMFDDDTRVLSLFRLTFGGRAPALLGTSLSRDNVRFTAHMTNRPLPPLGGSGTPNSAIHVERTRFLWQRRLYERITLCSYELQPLSVPLSLSFDADFRDMFEVRGVLRVRRGKLETPVVGHCGVERRYVGLDGVERRCIVSFSAAPMRLEAARADFVVTLAPYVPFTLYVEVGQDRGPAPDAARFREALVLARLTMRARRQRMASVQTSSAAFTHWLEQSRADLALLTSDLSTGPYPFAGIPWFSTPFGRDGVVTALETLWLDAGLARGVLRYLASRQASEVATFADAAPGKIMHETRRSEMCATGELPFGLYYGGVDTTPLFVVLAGAYADRTGDMALIDALWGALSAALGWVDGMRANHPHGLLGYQRAEASGLANQGWKDSEDSVFHADGRFPVGPIALVEVQGYVFDAYRTMAALARRRGDARSAAAWDDSAEAVRETVERLFWMPQRQAYGIALDGEGRLCETVTSNTGHLLFSRLPSPARAAGVIGTLLDHRIRSGWGLRTLATGEARFNPMSYHNGSVWPHDTALCAAGMRAYGEHEGPEALLGELFDAAGHFGMRVPELYCGFTRSPAEPPVGYPVACLPQAWSAAAPLFVLQACLGVVIDGWAGTVSIDRPRLPPEVNTLTVRDLQVGEHRVTLRFARNHDGGIEWEAHGTPAARARVFASEASGEDAGNTVRADRR